jgi:hypothetical protein
LTVIHSDSKSITAGWEWFGLDDEEDDDEVDDEEEHDNDELSWWESNHWTKSKCRSPRWTSSLFACLWSEASSAVRLS